MKDEIYMSRALELAEKGRGLVSPGALVGCVIVRKDQIIGSGFYTYDGIKHAETVALEEAGELACGATAFINLEPCSHRGRTPPCVDALINVGISRVVVAIEDPFSQPRGNGLARLREAGIDVKSGVLKEKGYRLNEAFSCFVSNKRPFGVLKVAMSLDGKIATKSGESRWITSDESRAFVQQMRHEVDALITGSGTVLKDDPLLTDRSGQARRRPLTRVILDRRGRLHSNLQIFSSPGVIIYTQLPTLDCPGADEVIVGEAGLLEVSRNLFSRGIQSFIMECGPDLAFNALCSGIIDKIVIFISPKIIGGREVPAFGSSGVESLAEAVQLESWSVETIGPDLILTGYVHWNH